MPEQAFGPQGLAPKRGEVWLADFDPKTGAEMGSLHPTVVVSRDDVGKLPLRVIVPVTTSQPALAALPWMVALTPDATNGLKIRRWPIALSRARSICRASKRAGELLML